MQIEYREVDAEDTPLGRLTLRSYRAECGETGYEILLDGAFLMASHGSSSERAMAGLAYARRVGPARPLTVLIGGLGAGHTLRAVLDLPNVGRVVVAEIGAKVEGWNRRFFAAVNGGAVDDPRVEVLVADVLAVLRARPDSFDLILLDVDNGPGWLAAAGNAALYDVEGLDTCAAALKPGGVLGVWSPRANPTFRTSLEARFRRVEEAEARPADEPASTIYLARSPRSSADGASSS